MKVKLNTGNGEEPLQYYVLKDGPDNPNYMVLLGKFFLCATFLLIIVFGGWYALEEQKVATMGDFIEAGVGMAENDVEANLESEVGSCGSHKLVPNCSGSITWALNEGVKNPDAPIWYEDIGTHTGMTYQKATEDDFQKFFYCEILKNPHCKTLLPPCSCSHPPCDVCGAVKRITGSWVDLTGGFYNGATIEIESDSWRPINPSLEVWKKASYTTEQKDNGGLILIETRASGQEFHHDATFNEQTPDVLEVTRTDGLKWHLTRLPVRTMGDSIEAGVGMAENDVEANLESEVGVSCFENGIDYLGNDMGSGISASSSQNCQNKCAAASACKYWTYSSTNQNNRNHGRGCHLKTSDSGRMSNSGCVSGPKKCGCRNIKIAVNSKKWGSEIRWRIKGYNKDATCNGENGYPNNSRRTKTCCLPEGRYKLYCEDTYGDGWHGGSISVAGVKYCSDFKKDKSHPPVFFNI